MRERRNRRRNQVSIEEQVQVQCVMLHRSPNSYSAKRGETEAERAGREKNENLRDPTDSTILIRNGCFARERATLTPVHRRALQLRISSARTPRALTAKKCRNEQNKAAQKGREKYENYHKIDAIAAV